MQTVANPVDTGLLTVDSLLKLLQGLSKLGLGNEAIVVQCPDDAGLFKKIERRGAVDIGLFSPLYQELDGGYYGSFTPFQSEDAMPYGNAVAIMVGE